VAGFIADEADELVRIAEIADVDGAGRHVAAQRDEMADAVLAILAEHVAYAVARRSDARQVRHAFQALAANLEHRRERSFARRSPGAEGDRTKRGTEPRELAPRRAKLRDAVGCLRREELNAVRRVAVAHDRSLPRRSTSA